jgi:DNA-binding transcriptional LysR family regulator
MGEIEAAARAIGQQQTGSLSLVTTYSVMGGPVAQIISEFAHDHPKVFIRVQNRAHQFVIDWIASHQYDLGIVYVATEHAGVETKQLVHDDCVCILPKDHTLAAKETVYARDLEDAEFISHTPGTYFRFKVDELFERAGVQRKCRIEAVGSAATCSLVAAGAGVSLVEPYVLADFPAGRLVVRPFRPGLPVGLSLLFPTRKPISRLARRFADALAGKLRTDAG